MSVAAVVAFGAGLLAGGYAWGLWRLWRAWDAPPAPASRAPAPAAPLLSVLVPARNEADRIGACLDSLLRQTYPHYEIIVIDDHSTDHTAAVVQNHAHPRLRLLHLADHLPAGRPVVAYKKAALQLGMQHATGDYFVTTDADCVAPPDWLQALSDPLRQGFGWVSAPVRIAPARGLLGAFQALDVAGTMVLTGAAVRLGHPLLANGANLLIERDLFQAVGGYDGNTHRASGDDLFLLQKVVKHQPERIAFVKSPSATVSTAPVATWPQFFRQRLRWAAKTSDYTDGYLLGFQAGVFLLSLLLLIAPWLTPWALLAWLIKGVADYWFLRRAAGHFESPEWLRWFWPAEVLQPFYIVLIGFLAVLPISVAWKGRRGR